MSAFLRMSDLELSGRRVLIRQDLNVPIRNGEVASTARIDAAVPTLRAALDAGAAVLVMSHLGRPTEGESSQEFSLSPVAQCLSEKLRLPVPLAVDWLDGVSVEPGSNLAETARFCQLLPDASPGAFGSKVGRDAIARISPVLPEQT